MNLPHSRIVYFFRFFLILRSLDLALSSIRHGYIKLETYSGLLIYLSGITGAIQQHIILF